MPDDKDNISCSTENIDAWNMFMRTLTHVHGHLCAAMESEHGIPMAWFEVLAALHRHHDPQGMRMQQLAESVMMSTSGLTRLVDRMVNADLVQRCRAEDRRVVKVSLTERGKEKIAIILPQHQQRVRHYFLQHLESSEISAITTSCERVLGQLADMDTDDSALV